MTDAGVLNAATGFRISEEMPRMLDGRLQYDAVRVSAASTVYASV